MFSSSLRALATLGFSGLLALTTACGGANQEAKAPTTEAAESQPVGSITPDLSPPGGNTKETLPEPPKSVAVSSSEDGSDIIPPFTGGKAATAAPAKKSGKGGAKKAGKRKKN